MLTRRESPASLLALPALPLWKILPSLPQVERSDVQDRVLAKEAPRAE